VWKFVHIDISFGLHGVWFGIPVFRLSQRKLVGIYQDDDGDGDVIMG
jgi:hypothetical protein